MQIGKLDHFECKLAKIREKVLLSSITITIDLLFNDPKREEGGIVRLSEDDITTHIIAQYKQKYINTGE